MLIQKIPNPGRFPKPPVNTDPKHGEPEMKEINPRLILPNYPFAGGCACNDGVGFTC